MGGGGSNQKMTKCDMGGGGVKNPDFRSDVLFAWPQRPCAKQNLCSHSNENCQYWDVELDLIIHFSHKSF